MDAVLFIMSEIACKNIFKFFSKYLKHILFIAHLISSYRTCSEIVPGTTFISSDFPLLSSVGNFKSGNYYMHFLDM